MSGTVCRGCGQENPEGARFCLACGLPLAEVAVPAERKVVTALFVDLVGYTELAERLDPEQVAAATAPFWRRVREEIERRAGTVEKYVGDAVCALFGAPVAHEDDVERALDAALAVRDWARAASGVDVRLGVATGEALVRLDTRPLAGEGTAVGDVVNTAARLQQGAPVNAVLVDGATRAAAGDEYELKAVPPITAKGKARPVQAWELLAARPQQPDPEPTALVGRATELALLSAAFRHVADQRTPQLVTIVGPPGIGKTRLARELHAALAAGGAVDWLEGRALPYADGGGSLHALAECVKRYVGILDTDGPAEAGAKLAATLDVLFADGAERRAVAEHVRALVGLPGAPEAVRDQRTESFAAWRRLIEAIAARRPVVVALDDVQWAERPLLEFVDHLVEWAVSSPILVLCTARPELLEEHTEWGAGRANALTMTLGPLTDDETAALLGLLLRREAGTVPTGLCTRTGGNPLYAEQFARMLRERLPVEQVPRSVQAVIGARIDALAPDEKELLENAAVVGQVFWPAALGAPPATGALHRLERKDLIARRPASTVEGEPEYAFRHVLVCDVAYARVPHSVRAEKHRRAAEWLAGVGDPERVADHYVRALDAARTSGVSTDALAERARVALRAAGERAIALNAFDAGIARLRAALALWPRDDVERPRILLELGLALWVGRTEGEQELVEARDALRAAGDREHEAEAEASLCELRWHHGDLPRSWRHLDAAAALVEDAPPSPVKAHVLARLARQLMLGASYERAIAVGREALALAERLGLDELRSHALNSIGSARTRAGDVDGIADVERAAEISLAALSYGAIVAYNNLASLHAELGDLRTSNDFLVRARALAEQLGNRSYLEWSDRELAISALQTGDWDAVEAGARRLDAAAAQGTHYLDASVRFAHAHVLQARGDPDAAVLEAERAEAAARQAGDPQVLLFGLADRAVLELFAGRRDEAEAYADEVVQLAESTQYLPSGASFALAVVLCACGRGDELLGLLDGLAQHNRWFDAARAYVGGEYADAAALYEEIGDRYAEAYCRVRAGDARGAAFYDSVGARARALV